jgi:hypothetical protein
LGLSRLTRGPISEVKIFFYLPALVTMLEWFFWPVIHLAERVFRILDCLTNDFQRFGHRLISFFQVWQGVKQAVGLSLDMPTRACLAVAASSDSSI